MPKITLVRELHHEQIEFPLNLSDGAGALHLQRGRARDVTADQLEWVRTHRPEIFRCLAVSPEPRVSGRAAKRLRQAQERKARLAVPAAAPKRSEAEKPKPARSRKRKA